MARMAAKYPQVTAMVCSGGGGRLDYGALKYFHSFWPSDNTDPRNRVFIQWGFSHFFPASTMAAHVTKMGGRPLKFALDVAMSGAFGLDMDVRKLTAGEKNSIAAAITIYKNRVRDVVSQGDLYRLESPYDSPRAALDYVSADRSHAILFVYQLKAGQRRIRKTPRPRPSDALPDPGTEPSRRKAGKTRAAAQAMDGAALMREGLLSPCRKEFDSAVFEFVEAPLK